VELPRHLRNCQLTLHFTELKVARCLTSSYMTKHSAYTCTSSRPIGSQGKQFSTSHMHQNLLHPRIQVCWMSSFELGPHSIPSLAHTDKVPCWQPSANSTSLLPLRDESRTCASDDALSALVDSGAMIIQGGRCGIKEEINSLIDAAAVVMIIYIVRISIAQSLSLSLYFPFVMRIVYPTYSTLPPAPCSPYIR
jgi:hypothetical protein